MENKREIKFRCWDKVNNRMIYPASSKNDTYLVFEESGWFVVDHFSGKNKTILKSENGELMEFTGLKDKEGAEIYEGDVVKCFHDGDHVGNIDVIEFDEGSFWLRYRFAAMWHWINFGGEFEVIGNIYTHPHLLEPKKEEKQ